MMSRHVACVISEQGPSISGLELQSSYTLVQQGLHHLLFLL